MATWHALRGQSQWVGLNARVKRSAMKSRPKIFVTRRIESERKRLHAATIERTNVSAVRFFDPWIYNTSRPCKSEKDLIVRPCGNYIVSEIYIYKYIYRKIIKFGEVCPILYNYRSCLQINWFVRFISNFHKKEIREI